MSADRDENPDRVYKIKSEDGFHYIVYNASVIGNPGDHVPDKWYCRTYSLTPVLGQEIGKPFETAEEAQRAAQAGRARSNPSRGRARSTTGGDVEEKRDR